MPYYKHVLFACFCLRIKKYVLKYRFAFPLRKGTMLKLPPSVGLYSWIFRGALVWNNLPRELKDGGNVDYFEHLIKSYALYCQCKICR